MSKLRANMQIGTGTQPGAGTQSRTGTQLRACVCPRKNGSMRMRFLGVLVCAIVLTVVAVLTAIPATARAAQTGSITVGGTTATKYNAYQLFDATVTDKGAKKIATDIDWANAAVRDAVLPVLHAAGLGSKATSAEDAAEWLNADGHMTGTLAMKLARAMKKAGTKPTALTANTPATLVSGYWLIIADDDVIGESQAGTAPIFAVVGGADVAVTPKAATPEVKKHVLEDSTNAWQKAADATVADDLYWRLSATVPAGLTSYDAYHVQFVDTMSAGLDPSRVVQSARVYVAPGTAGGFNAVTTKDGIAATDAAAGWTDITESSTVRVNTQNNTFTLRTADLVAALGTDAFATGTRVVVVYNAPLGTSANHCTAKGNPNEVYLRYPRSPFADQSGDAGFTRTPSDDATAYTWDLMLTKRGSDGDKPLTGAKLRIIDDRGRALNAHGAWQMDGKASVTTGADGQVTVSGVDSGKLTVEELEAPKGYERMGGSRTITIAIEGLDVKQVAAAKPKFTITAEKPLRADSADAQTGTVEASLVNTPSTPPVLPVTPPNIIRRFMPATGDQAMAVVGVVALAGVAALAVALLIKRGGGSHKG